MSEQQKQYVDTAGTLTKAFEVRTTAQGTTLAKGELRTDGGWIDLTIWEPETWFEGEWLSQMAQGCRVGVHGVIREREFTTQAGEIKRRSEVTVYAIAPLWEKPRRD